MEKQKMIAPCGIICDECPEYEKACEGCRNLKGKPTWVSYLEKEVCPLYECPVNRHQYETCGECKEMPCHQFRELRDPAMTDEEFEKNVSDRIALLKKLN